jgi:hypothetical protein
VRLKRSNPCESTIAALFRRVCQRIRPLSSRLASGARRQRQTLSFSGSLLSGKTKQAKLSTTDLLVLASMKNAAKCDK